MREKRQPSRDVGAGAGIGNNDMYKYEPLNSF
jgi:hypothetical protein